MKTYERHRENLWKEAWKNDPAFEKGEEPVAKVISYFCKKLPSDENLPSPPKEYDYDIKVSAQWLEERLNKTIQYTRKWNQYNLYHLSALILYLDEIKAGGYKGGIISKREFAMISPKK